MLDHFFKKYGDYFYVLFRVFVGLLFAQHGAQKLFGWFGANGSAELFSLMGFAGIIEFFGGILIALGLITQVVAALAAIQMLVAYFMAHLPNNWIPILNKGELALLYFAAFLVIMVHGSKKWGLDNIFES